MKSILTITTVCLIHIISFSQLEESKAFIIPFILLEDDNSEPEMNVIKSSGCSNSSDGTIGLADCSDVGTASYGTAGYTGVFDAESGMSAPSPSPPCGGAVNNGSWHVFDLDPGVDQVIIDYAGGFAGAGGFSDMYMSFYQGPDCSNLTNIDCGIIIEKVAGSLILHDLSISGLDDTQQLWVFTFASKNFEIDFTLTGTGPAPSNESCANAVNTGSGCNLGASGASFTPPTAAGQTCNGGTWSSNENTVFYTFTATSTTGSIEISNLICNDGTAGNAQIGVWSDCASVGTYGGSYLGCAVGTGNIILPALTVGDSYIIAVDGFAGDACVWDFTTTGVLLEIELLDLKATYNKEGYNSISWTTASEINNDYFILERGIDGKNWSHVKDIDGIGNSISTTDYSYKDFRFNEKEVNYYRLSQVNYDGEVKVIETFTIDNGFYSKSIVKIVDLMGQEVDVYYKGLRIIIYDDGTTMKKIGV